MIKYIPKGKRRKIHEAIPDIRNKEPYIYFLLKSGKIVYIGETRAIRLRIYQHNHYTDYDTIRIMSCPADKLTYYEQRWIIKFQPSLNILHTERRGNGRKYKMTFRAKIARKYISAHRYEYNLKNKERHRRKNEKLIKKEKLKAMILAGFSIEYASEKLGMKLIPKVNPHQ